MKFVSPFEPLSFWAQGPWVFFNFGLRFMQTWQEECFSRLSLVPGTASGKPATRKPERSTETPCEIEALNLAIAARQGRQTPLLGCLQNAEVVGGPAVKAAQPAVKSPAQPVAAKAVAAPLAVAAVEAVVEEAPTVASSASSVTSMLALQAKSLAKAVKTAPAAENKPAAKKASKPAAKAVQAPVKAEAKKPAAKTKPAVSKKA